MMFDLQPVLASDLLWARPLRASDREALYEVARDPLIWEQHPEPDRYRRVVFDRFFEESLASGGALAVMSPTGTVIGASRFNGYDDQRSEVEIGWTFLARSYWGGPANHQLKALMIAHAFRFVERVVFLVAPGNIRSKRALEKIGAACVGYRSDGSGNRSLLFELLRSDRCAAETEAKVWVRID